MKIVSTFCKNVQSIFSQLGICWLFVGCSTRKYGAHCWWLMQIKESSRGRLAAHMSDVPKKVAARFDRNNGLASHVIDVHGSFSNFTKFYRYFFLSGCGENLPVFCKMIWIKFFFVIAETMLNGDDWRLGHNDCKSTGTMVMMMMLMMIDADDDDDLTKKINVAG